MSGSFSSSISETFSELNFRAFSSSVTFDFMEVTSAVRVCSLAHTMAEGRWMDSWISATERIGVGVSAPGARTRAAHAPAASAGIEAAG